MSIAAKFNNLKPTQKRNVLAVAAISVVLGVSYLLASVTEHKASKTPRAAKPDVTVVSPARTTGVESFTAQLQLLQKAQDDLKSRYERLMSEKEAAKTASANEKENLKLDDKDLPALTSQTSVFEAPTSKPPALPPPPPAAPQPQANSNPNVGSAQQPAPAGAAPDQTPVPSASKGIRLIGEEGEVTPDKAEEKLNKPLVKTKAKSGSDSAYIPAGSMFTGVLLNGLDAPTSSVAQKNPTPVVIRIKREALLPNFASIDVRECFLVAAGYGQLSSERALMRAEALSCVRTDGQVIETKLDAYIVGPDGKVGIPGRLVSKQGQKIAQSLWAGALGGIGSSLNRTRVPSLNINPTTDHNIYQADSLSSIAQGGIAGGIGTATNQIAKFYLDMAKETFPVVEVPAGEVGTVVVTRGATLPLKGSTNLQRYVDPNERQRGSAANRNSQKATSGDDEDGHPVAQAVQAGATAGLEATRQAVSNATAAIGNKPNFQNGLGW